MKLLITGGCGFLGSNLSAEAIKRGEDVVIFDNLSRFGSVKNLEWLNTLGEFLFIHGDIRNQNDVTRLIQNTKPDAIFHLAGQVAMTTSIDDPRKDFDINVVGSYNLLEAVRQFSPETSILYSSTNKVYGDLEQFTYIQTDTRYVCEQHPNGFNEEITLSFHSPYGCSKGAADQYMIDYARIFNLKTVVFRHSSMYGGRQFSTYDQGWVGWFCQKAYEITQGNTTKFTISGNGKQVRDVLHADDVVKLYFLAISNIESIKGNAFNIGGGIESSLSLLELFRLLETIIKTTLVYDVLPPRESDQRVFVADSTKAKKLLNWKPQVSSLDGIDKMMEWIKSNTF
jgi:CDP-paratose 2-epimerase